MTTHRCDTGDFDRTICGCGMMHSYCSTCGDQQDACDEAELARLREWWQSEARPSMRLPAPRRHRRRLAWAYLALIAFVILLAVVR